MIFLVSEDMPQLVLQLLNNLLLGSQLTIIQVVTPITSLLMISYSVIVYLKWLCMDRDKTVKDIMPFSLIPLPLIGFIFYGAYIANWSVAGITPPAWIKQNFDTVRWDYIKGGKII